VRKKSELTIDAEPATRNEINRLKLIWWAIIVILVISVFITAHFKNLWPIGILLFLNVALYHLNQRYTFSIKEVDQPSRFQHQAKQSPVILAYCRKVKNQGRPFIAHDAKLIKEQIELEDNAKFDKLLSQDASKC
tara:strand:- start:1126 stop:1530 length:405 start_codon:yes stop_codon:yes gene_type:complete